MDKNNNLKQTVGKKSFINKVIKMQLKKIKINVNFEIILKVYYLIDQA